MIIDEMAKAYNTSWDSLLELNIFNFFTKLNFLKEKRKKEKIEALKNKAKQRHQGVRR